MRSWLLPAAVVACSLAGTGAANAVDSQASGEPVAAPPAASYVNWGGLHIGVQAGGLWGTAHEDLVDDTIRPTGAFGGGNFGYDFALRNNWLFGIEADANLSNAGASGTQPFILSTIGYDLKLDYFGTVRGRLGYAVGNNVIYGTGGWAWGQGTRSLPVLSFSDDQFLSGWTIGAGIDHMFTPNVIGRLQYLYTDYGSASYSIVGGETLPVRLTTNTLSLGVNLKF